MKSTWCRSFCENVQARGFYWVILNQITRPTAKSSTGSISISGAARRVSPRGVNQLRGDQVPGMPIINKQYQCEQCLRAATPKPGTLHYHSFASPFLFAPSPPLSRLFPPLPAPSRPAPLNSSVWVSMHFIYVFVSVPLSVFYLFSSSFFLSFLFFPFSFPFLLFLFLFSSLSTLFSLLFILILLFPSLSSLSFLFYPYPSPLPLFLFLPFLFFTPAKVKLISKGEFA
ncbi:hypothetical protein E2C01_049184 [Portunus trituberculatus]|uniref:Uncharacterized protein n=1 Tax=Portunus trituberculatus TaxID=210409 RepID=A0A5B7G8J2_PORTR|nr:hypothetical protein [Portunus trituberculatus]